MRRLNLSTEPTHEGHLVFTYMPQCCETDDAINAIIPDGLVEECPSG